MKLRKRYGSFELETERPLITELSYMHDRNRLLVENWRFRLLCMLSFVIT